MKKSPIKVLPLFFLVAIACFASAESQVSESPCPPATGDSRQRSALTDSPLNTSLITAAEYCEFLNHVALTDPDHLFDDAMATDPESACILCLGTPGDYSYEVIAGREHFPVMYVNDVAQQKYCDWLQHGAFVDEPVAGDPYLKSNQVGFQVAGLPGTKVPIFGPEVAAVGTVEEGMYMEVIEALGIVVVGALLAHGEPDHVTTSSHQLTEPTISQVEPPRSRYRLANDGKTWEKSNPQGKWEATDEIDTSSHRKEVGYDGYSSLDYLVVDTFSKNYNRLYVIDKKTEEYEQALKKLPAGCDSDEKSRLESGLTIIKKASDYEKKVLTRFEEEQKNLPKDSRLEQASLSVKIQRIEERTKETAENPFEKLAEQLKKNYHRLAFYKDKLSGLELLLAAQPDNANILEQVEYLAEAINAQRALITTRTEHAQWVSSDPSKPITPESKAEIERNKWNSVEHDSRAQAHNLFQQWRAEQGEGQIGEYYLYRASNILFRVAEEAQKPIPNQEVISWLTRSADLFQQAAAAKYEGQQQKAENLNKAATNLYFVAREAEKPTPNPEVISLFTRSSDFYQQAADAGRAGQEQKAEMLNDAAMALWMAARVADYNIPKPQAISLYTDSANLYQKAAAAHDAGQQTKADNLTRAAWNLKKAAREAEKSTPNQEAISWHIRNANLFQQAAAALEEHSCTIM